MTMTYAPEDDAKPTFGRSLEALRARAGADTVPTGILVELKATPFSTALRDGARNWDALDQRGWEETFYTIRGGALPHLAMSTLDDVRAVAAARAADGEVPIAILDARYDQPTRKLAARILHAWDADAEIALPPAGDVLEERHAFAAAALLPVHHFGFERQPDVHVGLDPTFRLDPAMVVGNTGRLPDAVEIDFDDGQGFVSVALGGAHAVRYDREGQHRVVLRATYGDDVRHAAFFFAVRRPTAEAATIPPWEVVGTIPYLGVCNKGTLHAYLATGSSGKLTRPILMAEGFGGGNTAQGMYDRLNGWNGSSFNPDARLADALRDRGFDLVFFLYEPGKGFDPIQRNAFTYVEAVKSVWERMGRTGKMIVSGASMGGLVTRYALSYAQQHGIDVGTVAGMLTFDTPNLGAVVPYAVQCGVRFFEPASQSAKDTCKLLDTHAARQMLMYQRWTHDQNEVAEKPEFTGFFKELEGLANKGYPTAPRRLAIANGAGNGAARIAPLSRGVHWWLGEYPLPLAKADLWTLPNGSAREETMAWIAAATVRWPGRYYTVYAGMNGRDGCSGGTSGFFGQMADGFRAIGKGRLDEQHRVNCFIPTHSALGYAVKDAYAFRADQTSPSLTPFHAFGTPASANLGHCVVDSALRKWALDNLTPIVAEDEPSELPAEETEAAAV